MADVYCHSGAAGSGTGADWANAYTTLAAALTAAGAGGRVWLAHDHAESQATTINLTSPGTAAAPCRILCVDRAGSVPPVSADLRATATVTTTGASSINYAGFAYVYGVTFSAATGAVGNFNSFMSASAWGWTFEKSVLKNATTSVVDRVIAVGTNFSTAARGRLTMIDSQASFANNTQGFGVAGAELVIKGGGQPLLLTGSAIPTTLFRYTATQPSTGGSILVMGVDLSQFGSGNNLVDVSAPAGGTTQIRNCKLGASVALSTGTIPSPAAQELEIANCDSADTNYKYYRNTFSGEVFDETTIVLTGGASDGTTPLAWKLVTNASASQVFPLVSPDMVFWNDAVGVSKTVTVEIVNDGDTLTNAEAWIEVEYLGTSGVPWAGLISDAPADPLAAPANQASSSVTWTTTGLASPVKQALSVTFTPQEKGLFRARVNLAKASKTIYVDPLLTVS